MPAYVTNIESVTRENENFRKVLFTAPHSQLVVMCLQPKEDIGMEIHPNHDQFIRIEIGEGEAILDGKTFELADGSAVVIPAGTEHNIINKSAINSLKLYSIYSPAKHADGIIHRNKAEAEKEDE